MRGTCLANAYAHAWCEHSRLEESIPCSPYRASCHLPLPLHRTATLRVGAQAFPDGSAVVRHSAADAPGCTVPGELGPAWFMRRFAWYKHHVSAAPGLRLRMLPAIRVASAHRRWHARPWNDTDFSAAAATRGRRFTNSALLQRARRTLTRPGGGKSPS